MSNTVIIGAQWGDEGKGKIIDVLTEESDWVVRYQGGNNAGHTVEIDHEKYILHLVPSGILHPNKKCVIGNGVVIDLPALAKELADLQQRNLDAKGRLFLSDRAHLVFTYHRSLDEAREGLRSADRKIGTTKRGIGPSYADKASRTGLRVCDAAAPDFATHLERRIQEENLVLTAMGAPTLDVATVVKEHVAAATTLAPYFADTTTLINEAIKRGDSILFEGAQGTMLDLDHGTYPFVTSSSTVSGGACTGSGVPPHGIDRVVGVVKAYTTRVGEGPFPTELKDRIGQQIREDGREFGATTGRPRRCGWFDAVVARYSVMINGIDTWAVTKLDVLDNQETIRICTAYEYNGKRLTSVPASSKILEQCVPVYEDWPGWRTSTKSITRFDDLPAAAKSYLRRIEDLTEVPIGILSLGPGRDKTLFID